MSSIWKDPLSVEPTNGQDVWFKRIGCPAPRRATFRADPPNSYFEATPYLTVTPPTFTTENVPIFAVFNWKPAP